MANFFTKVKNLIKKKEPEKEPFVFDFTKPEDPQIDEDGLTPAQRERRRCFYETIEKGHEISSEYQGLTKEKAKEDLRRSIQEKIDAMNSYGRATEEMKEAAVSEGNSEEIVSRYTQRIDVEEIMSKISEENEQKRANFEERSKSRHKRHERMMEEQANMEPVVTEDAVIAVFGKADPDNTPSPEPDEPQPKTIEEIKAALPSYADMDVTLTPLEGQIAIRDIKDELKKAQEQEEKEHNPEPDITEIPLGEALKQSDIYGDKVFTVVIKGLKHAAIAVKAFFETVFSKIRRFVTRLTAKKDPEKAVKLSQSIGEKKAGFNLKKKALTGKLVGVKDLLIEKEDRVSTILAEKVNLFDHKQGDRQQKAEDVVQKSGVRIHRFRHWADLNKRYLILGFSGVVALTLIVIAGINWATAYEYAYNGKTLGMVKNQEDVTKILDIVSEQLSKEHSAEVYIDKDEDITFKRVWNFTGDTDTQAEVLRTLTYMQDMSVTGYRIVAEGSMFGVVESEEMARQILKEVRDTYAPPNESIKYEDVGFAENVVIEPYETKLGLLLSHDEMLYKILTGAEERMTHIVQSGETFSEIANMYGISQADLQASNPTVNPARLSIGQEIVLNQAVPLLTVQTVEISTYIEYLDYETVYEDSASIYQGETTVKRAGKPGEREVKAKIVKNNGLEVAKLELSSQITQEPVSAIVVRGTKALPPKKGTGSFIYPVTGYRLTSKFGQRWGRMHNGVDLACPTGTKIRAADGGTVIFSGYSGSYGYVVKIDHGGGYVTVYAHCSKLHVKVGEAVYQGQHIANVGSTGRSTGPHCHFEIQYLGTPKNPLNYL